jgi:XTP/dITP diphosphohydrolase
MTTLTLATKNKHKTSELIAILGAHWNVTDLTHYPEIASPDETGRTFAENASIKAISASSRLSGWVLADDSGLEVDALDGAPGVLSARYAGPGATDAENRAQLLWALAGFQGEDRRGRFRCALALAKDGKIHAMFEGVIDGTILHSEQGSGGFGYDNLFIPCGYDQSFGQLASEQKNQISHRSQALTQASATLATLVFCRINGLPLNRP